MITPLLVFVLQMALHPEILARAQEEVDRVVGDARLPDFDDRPLLPYIDCIERELFRYVPIDHCWNSTGIHDASVSVPRDL